MRDMLELETQGLDYGSCQYSILGMDSKVPSLGWRKAPASLSQATLSHRGVKVGYITMIAPETLYSYSFGFDYVAAASVTPQVQPLRCHTPNYTSEISCQRKDSIQMRDS